MKKFISLTLSLSLLLAALSGCGAGGANSADIAASGSAVTGDAVSGEAVSTTKPNYAEDVCMHLELIDEGDTHIPDPTEVQDVYEISLKGVPDEYAEEDEYQYKGFETDLSFIGIGSPAYISTYDIGYMGSKDGKVCLIESCLKNDEYTGAAAKKREGNCLILIATEYTDVPEDENAKTYIVVFDYENHRIYKEETNLCQYRDNIQTITTEMGDVTNDGADDVLVSRGEKGKEYLIYRIQDDKLECIFSSEEYYEKKQMPSNLIKFKKLDDYKIKISYPVCDWEYTFSLVKECNLSPDELDVSSEGAKWDSDDDWMAKDSREWDKGKYIGGENQTYLASEYDKAWFEKTKDGLIKLVMCDFIALIHRDSVGDIYTYFKYDSEENKFVIDDAKFIGERESYTRVSKAIDEFAKIKPVSDEYMSAIKGEKRFIWMNSSDGETKVDFEKFYEELAADRGLEREASEPGASKIYYTNGYGTSDEDLMLELETVGGKTYMLLHVYEGNVYGYLFTPPYYFDFERDVINEKIYWTYSEFRFYDYPDRFFSLDFKDGKVKETVVGEYADHKYKLEGKTVSKAKYKAYFKEYFAKGYGSIDTDDDDDEWDDDDWDDEDEELEEWDFWDSYDEFDD